MTFSIIVPIFNAEKYIRRCIESIICQTYTNFEVILIDDGSHDHSLEICLEYKSKDTRIKVIEQKNQGVSSARNIGIKESSGNWIIFIDADDWINKNALKISAEILNRNTEFDTLIWSCSLFRHKKEEAYIKYKKDEIINQKQFWDVTQFHPAVWGYVFSKKIISEKKICFKNKLSMSEDRLFLAEYVVYSKRNFTIKENLYYYFSNENSICNTESNLKKCLDQLNACKEIYKLRKNIEIPREITKYHNQISLNCLYAFVELIKKKKVWSNQELKVLQKHFRKTLRDINYINLFKSPFWALFISIKFYLQTKK